MVYREDLEFSEDRDPTAKGTGMSNTKRKILFEELKEACGVYIRDDLPGALVPLISEQCRIVPDDKDPDQQTLLVEYPTLYPGIDNYVLPQVKLEAGARSAMDPNIITTVGAYVEEEI